MKLYAVRKIEGRAAVGLFWANDFESMGWMVDSEFDVTACEYKQITDRNMFIWPSESVAFAMGTIEGPVAASDARDAGKIDIAPDETDALEQRRRQRTSTMSIGEGSFMELFWGDTETTGWTPLDPTGNYERRVAEGRRIRQARRAAAERTMLQAFWRGAEGRMYEFLLDPLGSPYLDRPGIFVFCKSDGAGGWYPIFVGETESFARTLTPEFENDAAWECIGAADPTHVGTLHWPGSPSDRRTAANDLIGGIKPLCNNE
jgi:hypothetical protein